MDGSRSGLLGCFSKEATNSQEATLLTCRKEREGKRMGFTLLMASYGPGILGILTTTLR